MTILGRHALRILIPLVAVTLLATACGDAETIAEPTPADDAAAPSTAIDETTTAPPSTKPAETAPTEAVDPDPTDSEEIVALPLVANDPLLSEQWGLEATGVPDAWSRAGGDGVVIAIIDTGVDLDHPDLVDNLVPGWDFVDNDDQPDDPNGHGTHVAGVAAAASNPFGIAGAAPNAKIMPIRVLDADGGGNSATIAEAVRWAAANGADVINLSLGESGFVSRFTKGGELNLAIREVAAHGVVVIAASGNEGTGGQQYRIGVDVLVVNATAPDGSLTSFSNLGDVRAISAPGQAILSSAPPEPTSIWPDGTDGWAELDGTSMATPLVAGIAALTISAGEDPTGVIDLLVSTAANPTGDPLLGAGIVDAAAALGCGLPSTTLRRRPHLQQPRRLSPIFSNRSRILSIRHFRPHARWSAGR